MCNKSSYFRTHGVICEYICRYPVDVWVVPRTPGVLGPFEVDFTAQKSEKATCSLLGSRTRNIRMSRQQNVV